MTRIRFDCDRCGKPVSGLHCPTATAGFYVVSERGAFAKYGREDEHLVCDPCVQSDPAYRADYGLEPIVDSGESSGAGSLTTGFLEGS